jgi:hypothetical protein
MSKKILAEIQALQEKEQKLIAENMPKFQRGIVEASLERERAVWLELQKVFEAYHIAPSVRISIVNDNQPSKEPGRPYLVCPGVRVDMQYIVNPEDTDGKSGKMPSKIVEEIGKGRKKIEELKAKLK